MSLQESLRNLAPSGGLAVGTLLAALACSAKQPPASAAAPREVTAEGSEGAPAPRSEARRPNAAQGSTTTADAGGETPRSDATKRGETPPQDDDLEAMLAELEEEDRGIREIPECNSLRGADDCTGVGEVMLGCIGLGNVLRQQPTKALVACLQRLNGSETLCEAAALKLCGLPVIDAASPSEVARKTCNEIFERCGPPRVHADLFTEGRCARGLTAARERSARDFSECMLRRCDLKLCLSGVL